MCSHTQHSLHQEVICEYVDCGHKPSTYTLKKNIQWGWVMVSMAAGTVGMVGWAANHSVTARKWWNATLAHTTTKCLTSPLSSTGASLPWSSSRNKMRRSVLYSPMSGLCSSNPSEDNAAHMVILAPHWPGKCNMNYTQAITRALL